MSTVHTTATPARDLIHAGQPITAHRVHDYNDHLIGVDIATGAAASLLRDLIRHLQAHPLDYAAFERALEHNPVDKYTAWATNRIATQLGTAGALTFVLDPHQGGELAEQLDAACVDPDVCRCGRFIESGFTAGVCGPCQDGGR